MNDKVWMLKEEPGFIKLFTLFKEKYRSLGRIGGTVSLRNFSREEIEAIAGLLGKSPDSILEKGKLSLTTFEQELDGTIFAGYSLIQLIEEVLQESIFTKQEENELILEKEKEFFQKLRSEFPEGSWWWDWIEAKLADSRWVWNLYRQDSNNLFAKLSTVFHAFQELPWKKNQYERLPLFAQRTTGNPHFFDSNQVTGKLLTYCMQVYQQLEGNRETGMPKTTEELNDLLSCFGLMRDDLWSFVSCRGFFAEGKGGFHPVWKAAVETDTILNVPIKELLKLEKVWPAKGLNVWIVENSSVCSTIVDEVPLAPVICTHGQFRAASWVLLDMLIQSGCRLYYSGDLDPEGIMMAQRLKDRYQDQVTIWRMDQESYQMSVSEEDISSRISKMDVITASELVETVYELKNKLKAGYQEGLISELISDIKMEFLS